MTKDHPTLCGAHGELHPCSGRCLIGRCAAGLQVLLFAATLSMLSACGGSSSSAPQPSGTLSGNWQYSMTNPDTSGHYPPGERYGLQGGFLLQNNGSVTGQAVYSISGEQTNNQWAICDSGSAPINGTISGQTVNFTAVAGSQTFTLQATLGSNGSITNATFTTPGGNATGFVSCGMPTPSGGMGLSWSAVSVPPITGTIQGSFHSTGGGAGLSNQDFVITGSLTQGENIGASNATVTGMLSFLDPLTNLSDYPCVDVASVNGQISGNSVILQIIGTNGSTLGQIGGPPGSYGITGINTVTFDSANGGYILHGLQPTYLVATKPCGGSLGSATAAGDYGNICLALNSSACNQPITLSPAIITFPAQLLGSAATTQTITLTNNSGAPISGLTLKFSNNYDNTFGGFSDFNGLPSFTETDACGAGGVPSQGKPFDLASGQACFITVTSSPQESCPWLPFGSSPPDITGAAPEWCPLFAQSASVTATVPANTPPSGDSDKTFAVPITGIGASAIVPSTRELDFGAEEQFSPPEASLPQMLSFTNNGGFPVQILGSAPCTNPPKGQLTLPHDPLLATSPVAGLQVVSNGSGSISDITANGNTISYNCDSDPSTTMPNFQISSDTCTGAVLAPQASCSLEIAFVPQPMTAIGSGLAYFLELNTVQCWPAGTLPSQSNPCEIDGGRFPVELRANTPSPLRMSPGAGLDFGNQTVGKSSAALQITLLNDPNLANQQTVTFVGKVQASGNYSETDDCPGTLAPGTSCVLTVKFKPGTTGFLPGTLTINYFTPTLQNVPQFVYLRGTGQ